MYHTKLGTSIYLNIKLRQFLLVTVCHGDLVTFKDRLLYQGNVLFNDTLDTFYLWLYGVGHMVKDHSDSEREETDCRHMGYSFRITARFFYMHHPTDRIAHIKAFVTPVVEDWLE